jgi:putative flippase GtrA
VSQQIEKSGKSPLISSSKKSTLYRVLRYLFIGGSSFALDFGMVFVFHVLLNWPIWLATGVAFVATFIFTYSFQRAFSFSSRSPHAGALLRYSALVAVNTVATIAIVSALDATIVGWGFGKVIATGVTTVGNYFAYRHWVFPRPDQQTGKSKSV